VGGDGVGHLEEPRTAWTRQKPLGKPDQSCSALVNAEPNALSSPLPPRLLKPRPAQPGPLAGRTGPNRLLISLDTENHRPGISPASLHRSGEPCCFDVCPHRRLLSQVFLFLLPCLSNDAEAIKWYSGGGESAGSALGARPSTFSTALLKPRRAGAHKRSLDRQWVRRGPLRLRQTLAVQMGRTLRWPPRRQLPRTPSVRVWPWPTGCGLGGHRALTDCIYLGSGVRALTTNLEAPCLARGALNPASLYRAQLSYDERHRGPPGWLSLETVRFPKAGKRRHGDGKRRVSRLSVSAWTAELRLRSQPSKTGLIGAFQSNGSRGLLIPSGLDTVAPDSSRKRIQAAEIRWPRVLPHAVCFWQRRPSRIVAC